MTCANNKEDELITRADDSWSFQQDQCLSKAQMGLDTYYFSSFCGCSAWSATSSKGCRHFKEHQSRSHNSTFKGAQTSYYTTVTRHWKFMNVTLRQMSKPTCIWVSEQKVGTKRGGKFDWILIISKVKSKETQLEAFSSNLTSYKSFYICELLLLLRKNNF